MVRRYYDLPPLTALAVFEASARHGNFRLAAGELNVTPGAVSRQVKALEDEIGQPLFLRGSGGVRLTGAGQTLYEVLARSFSEASQVVRELRKGERAQGVTVACTDAFATFWLIPRMADFWERFPEIAVDHLISDDPRDFRRGEVELRVRYGSGAWPDERSELLFGDTIFPVCGTGFAAQHASVEVDELWRLPLLHVDWVDPDWTGWNEVLRRAGVSRGSLGGRRFGKFSVALQAALADQGVAVGWQSLVREHLADGRLVRLTGLELPAPGGYHLTWNATRPLSPSAQVFAAWLRKTAAREADHNMARL